MCPECNSMEMEWAPVSGKGSIYSWTVVYDSTHPDFVEDTPFAVVMVQLDEQDDLRVVGNIVDCSLEDIKAGIPDFLSKTKVLGKVEK